MKRLLLALLILPLFAQAAEYELGKGYHFVKMSGKLYALPPMMAPAQNPSNADQALTRSWATASSAGHAGALAVVSAMGPSPSSNPSNANQVLSDVWNSANDALTIYCVSGCGSQGPTGATGAAGASGAAGATGPTGPVGSSLVSSCAGTVSGVTYQCVVDLSAATINHLFSAPPVIVAAPGSGLALSAASVYAQGKFGTIQNGIQTSGRNVSFGFPASGATLSVHDTVFESTTSQIAGTTSFAPNGAQTSFANTALSLSQATSDAAGWGAIATSNITAANAGTGYVNGDTFTVSGCGSTHATGTVLTTTATAVATYSINNPAGSGYVASTGACTTTATSGVGTGLELDIGTITIGDGTGRVWVIYTVNTLR